MARAIDSSGRAVTTGDDMMSAAVRCENPSTMGVQAGTDVAFADQAGDFAVVDDQHGTNAIRIEQRGDLD